MQVYCPQLGGLNGSQCPPDFENVPPCGTPLGPGTICLITPPWFVLPPTCSKPPFTSCFYPGGLFPTAAPTPSARRRLAGNDDELGVGRRLAGNDDDWRSRLLQAVDPTSAPRRAGTDATTPRDRRREPNRVNRSRRRRGRGTDRD